METPFSKKTSPAPVSDNSGPPTYISVRSRRDKAARRVVAVTNCHGMVGGGEYLHARNVFVYPGKMPMRRVAFILPVFLTFALPSPGQDSYPRGEVFGGYTFSRYSVDSTGHTLNGWGASVSGNITRYFGVIADFSGVYGSEPYAYPCTLPVPPGCPPATQNLNAYHFLAGPRFTHRTHKAAPFAQLLFGVVDLRQEKSGNRSGFAMGLGGGVDVPVGKHLAYRLFQADYIPAKRPNDVGGWDHDFRLETGLVFTFGRK